MSSMGGAVVARLTRTNSLSESQQHVAQAKRLAEKYAVDRSNPGEYLTPLPLDEQDAWERLLDRMK